MLMSLVFLSILAGFLFEVYYTVNNGIYQYIATTLSVNYRENSLVFYSSAFSVVTANYYSQQS